VTTTTADLLAQLLAGACDDERVKLPPRATKRLAARMAELAEVEGWMLVRQPPAVIDLDDLGRRCDSQWDREDP